MGRDVFLLLKLTHEAKTQTLMYIFYLIEAVYISHVLGLEKKGLECSLESIAQSYACQLNTNLQM